VTEAVWFATKGVSMFPTLLPGDRVRFGACGGTCTGDLVGYIGPIGELILHRVMGYCSVTERYLTAGDGNSGLDGPVPVSAVVGRVVAVRRRVLGVEVVLPRAFWRWRVVPRRLAGRLRGVAMWIPRPLRKLVTG